VENVNNYVIIEIVFSRVVQYSSQPTSSEGGAKNPLKGTSMKFLVLACGAQPRVDTGS
jgi:hypothetical protein